MKGEYPIVVQNATVKYEFVIRRNITVIRGDSATGKTTLIDMIAEYYEAGDSSGVSLSCPVTCAVISGRDWKAVLATMSESIIFIDEGNAFVFTDEFSRAVRESDNYYVIVSREGLPNLPYSVEEIYGIRTSGKYATLKQTYNEFYRFYENIPRELPVRPEQIICEDSNAGFSFFEGVSKGASVISAEGKSNVFEKAGECTVTTVVVADGAAFGSEMDRMVKLLSTGIDVFLYLPESFEWLILKSGVVDDGDIPKILDDPSEYIDSKEHFSWERYFTELLSDRTRNTYMQYGKAKLNPVYLRADFVEKILAVVEEAVLLW